MPPSYWILILICTVVLVVLLLLDRPWRRRSLLAMTIVLTGGSAWLGIRAVSVAKLETKASTDAAGWMLVALLFLAMSLGMAAQYFFFKPERSRFRWARLAKPFFASPIVFIPLVGTLPADDLSLLPFSLSKLMLLLVAFQNGFFWKTFFDSARPQGGSGNGD